MRDYPNHVRVVGSWPTFAASQPSVRPALLKFHIRLPYHLPLSDGSAFRMSRSSDPRQPPWVVLNYRQFSIGLIDSASTPYQTGLGVLRGKIAPEKSESKSIQSWIIAETLDVAFDDEPPARKRDEVLTRAFERCLLAINLLSESSRLTSKEILSFPLSKDSLDPEASFLVTDSESGEICGEYAFRVNQRMINPVSIPYNESDVREGIRSAIARKLESDAAGCPHPFITARAIFLEAQNQRMHGASSASIVSLQASVESMLRGLCVMLHRDLGTPSKEILSKAEMPFESLLKKELPNLLGGRWSGATSVPTEFRTKLYNLRNRIVHAGYSPSYREVNPAFAVREDLVEFIEKRLTNQWRRYPKTTLAWHDSLAGGPNELPKAARGELEKAQQENKFYWV